MQTIIINNVEFNNFGANNYSCGMQLISCYPALNRRLTQIEKLLNSETK